MPKEIECGHGNRFLMEESEDGRTVSYTPLHEIFDDHCFLGTIKDYRLPDGI